MYKGGTNSFAPLALTYNMKKEEQGSEIEKARRRRKFFFLFRLQIENPNRKELRQKRRPTGNPASLRRFDLKIVAHKSVNFRVERDGWDIVL